jgi:dihydrofolate reductase
MTKVTTGATMSLDGYVSGPNNTGFEYLFRWYGSGDVEIPNDTHPELSTRTSAASAEHLRQLRSSFGALVCGRGVYDLTGAWNGRHPLDVPCVVMTHRLPDDRPAEDENFVFVTDGIEAAVAKAKELAGDKDVGLTAGTVARQALEAGLLDEVHIDLVPVFLGSGTPYLSELGTAPVELEGPISLVEGDGVTHIGYRVVRQAD